MNYFALGRAATKGVGPASYTLRFPLWPGDNVRIDEIEDLDEGQIQQTIINGQQTVIEKRAQFLLLRMHGFRSVKAARTMWDQLSKGLILLSAKTGASLQFPGALSEIAREDDPNIQFREQIRESELPSLWGPRTNGRRTDGGIFPFSAYILPEHERIWEYPVLLAKPLRTVDLSQVGLYLSRSEEFPIGAAENNKIRMAVEALWLACAHHDRRIQYVLLVTVLDILAEGEDIPNWTAPIKNIVLEVQAYIRSKSTRSTKDIVGKLERAVGHIGHPGNKARIHNLVSRALGTTGGEVADIWKTRSKLAHGGGFSYVPTADECENLRIIVSAVLDRKMLDVSASDAS